MIGERRLGRTSPVSQHGARPVNGPCAAMLRKTAPVWAASQKVDPASQSGLNLGDFNEQTRLAAEGRSAKCPGTTESLQAAAPNRPGFRLHAETALAAKLEFRTLGK